MNAKHQHFQATMLDLVSKKGFKATTMRDLAQAMNCDVSNIYNYIDSKQSFLDRVLFEMNDIFHDRIKQIQKSDYNPIEQLKQIVRLYVELSVERPLELSLLVNEWRNLKADRMEIFVKKRLSFELKVSTIIAYGLRDNLIKKMDINLATHLFLSSLRLLFHQQNSSSLNLEKIELERQINIYIFEGLAI